MRTRSGKTRMPVGVRFEGGGAPLTASAGAVLLLDLLGLDRVEDVERLEADGAVRAGAAVWVPAVRDGAALVRAAVPGVGGAPFPSPRAVRDWLGRRRAGAAGRRREKGEAYIPPPSLGLLVGEQMSRRLPESAWQAVADAAREGWRSPRSRSGRTWQPVDKVA